ncbi:MAG: hypothetical protein AAGG68_08800, partial [Bacteroidota bacterium]
MAFLIQYRTLFEVRILHGYHLNGAEHSYWDNLEDLSEDSDERKKIEIARARRKLNYDVRNDL